MSRHQAQIAILLFVLIVEAVFSAILMSFCCNLDSQHGEAGRTLTRQAILSLRPTFCQLDQRTRHHIRTLGCAARRRGTRGGQLKATAKVVQSPIPVLVGNRPRNNRIAPFGNTRLRVLISIEKVQPDLQTDYNCRQSHIPAVFGNRPHAQRRHSQQQHHDRRLTSKCRTPTIIEIPISHSWSFPNFLNANVRSIVSKIDEFTEVLHTNRTGLGCATESWLKDEIPSSVVNIDGYICHRKDRSDGRRGGGVVVYTRNDLPCRRLTTLEQEQFEVIWLLYRATRMPRSVSHIAVGAVYHPPSANSRMLVTYLLDCLDQLYRDHPHAGVVLLGDFNQMHDAALLSYPLKQIVKSTTRGSATLDKIYTNIGEWYQRPFCVPPIGHSDHNPVVMLASSTDPRPLPSTNPVTVRKLGPSGKTLLAHAVKEINWSPLYRMQNPDDMVTFFNSVVCQILDQHMTTHTSRQHSRDKPWVDDQFRYLIRRRQFAWRNGLWSEYRAYRNRVQRVAWRLRRKFYERKLQNLRSTDCRRWWKNIKELTGQSSSKSCQLGGLADQLTNGDMEQLAENINSFFHSVSADLEPLDLDSITVLNDALPEELIMEPFDIEQKLANIDVSKSPGPDGIPNWFLRDFSVWLAEPVSCIFNTSVTSGVFPQLWKQANVVPVPKVQPPCNIKSDLRPISLTPTLSKLLESYVGSWMVSEVITKLDQKQFGSLRGRSTTHALVDMTHMWYQALDQSLSARVLFVDLSKAFDRVDHTIVLNKLVEFGIPSSVIKWFASFLNKRQQRVKIGNLLSSWLTLKGSIPQGAWLGPFSFIVLIDSLKPSCPTHKYVDDTTLTEILSRNQPSCIDVYLNELRQWSVANNMLINEQKTKEMIITLSRTLNVQNLPDIERVDKFKLLGIYVSYDLSWNNHVAYIYRRANCRLHFLRQLKRAAVSHKDMLTFYIAVIRPVMEYAAPVWHSGLTAELAESLESVQKRALRIIFGGSSFTNSTYLSFCESLSISSLQFRRESLSINFFQKILEPSSCLHYLIPNKRTNSQVKKLRNHSMYSPPFARTKKFKSSFLVHALYNYV